MHGYSHTALGLSTYAVTLYKKFGRSMDSGLILQLVTHWLKSFRSTDLVILKELIAKTTQIQPQANLMDHQVACMGGGQPLHIEALAPDTRGSMSISHLMANKNGIQWLSRVLQRTDLTIVLLVLIVQQQEFCIKTMC